MTDRHYRVVLHVREPYDEDADAVEDAAAEAAAAAAHTLAHRDYGGTSASVEFEVVFGDRTVPTSPPRGPNARVVSVHRDAVEEAVLDEDEEELFEEDEREVDLEELNASTD